MLSLIWAAIFFVGAVILCRAFITEFEWGMVLAIFSAFAYVGLTSEYTLYPLTMFLNNALPQKGEDVHWVTVAVLVFIAFLVLAFIPLILGSTIASVEHKRKDSRKRNACGGSAS
ncbi:hypothetical protein ACQHIH_21495 (plasmid) [Xanthomonas sontii]|uniref:hypothetical protein n=1 Tax=Xanthomonas sontii TaxID=2650745 RepID=UPI003F871F52